MEFDLQDVNDSLSNRATFAKQISEVDTSKRTEIENEISRLRTQLSELDKKKKDLQKQATLDFLPEFVYFKDECNKFYHFLNNGLKCTYKVLTHISDDKNDHYQYLEGLRSLSYERIDLSDENMNGGLVFDKPGKILIRDFTVSEPDIVLHWERTRGASYYRKVKTRIPIRWFTDRKNFIEELTEFDKTYDLMEQEKLAKAQALHKLKRKVRRAGGDEDSIELSSTGTLFDTEKFLALYDSLEPQKLKEYFYPYDAIKALSDYAFVTGGKVYCEDIFAIFAEPLESMNKKVDVIHQHAINEVYVKVFGALVNRHEILWQPVDQ